MPLDWRQIIDAMADAVVAVDSAGRIAHANPATSSLLAWPPETLPGMPLEELLPPSVRRIGERSFLDHLLARMEALGGRPIRAPIRRRDGVELLMDWRVVSASGPAGDAWTVLFAHRPVESVDFTADPAEAPQALGTPEQSYRLVFENAPVGIFHFDSRGVITACNDVFVTLIGSSKRLLIGLDMRTLPNAEITRCVGEAIAGRHARYEGEYTSATGGRTAWVHVGFAPIFDAAGAVAGGVGIVEDVSEAKRSEQALARADRMASLGTLAAGVAHEINNPLAYLMTSVDLALRNLASFPLARDPEKLLDETTAALASAREGAERVGTIVDDLRIFARSDDSAEGVANVEAALDTAVSLAWNEIRHRALLSKNFSQVPPVRGDQSKLVQVFLNLLVNAAQAMPDGDASHNKIELVTDVGRDGRVVIEVRDTGEGIRPEHREHIFEPFWTTKPVGTGTGLGLSICHGIVASMDGEISVHPHDTAGTTFRVALPTATARAQPPAPMVTDTGAQTEPARVLVIDDEIRLAETLQLALRPHRVDYVLSGTDAIARLTGPDDYDLVLCDLMLPDLSGPDIFETILARRPELGERFVFMTGGAFTDRARDFLRAVDNLRLEKPFDLEELEQLIQSWPRRSRVSA